MLLPNTPFRSAAAACSVPYPPAASAKRNVPVTSRIPSNERTKLSGCAAYSHGDAPTKYPAELLSVSSSITKRRSGGRYLLVIMRAGGIGVREVDFCGACDHDQTKVHFVRFRGALCPVAIGVPHFPHCTIWEPRCRGASAVLLQRQIRCFPYTEFRVPVGHFFLRTSSLFKYWTSWTSSLFKYETSLLFELYHDVKVLCSWALFRTFTFF